jgi:hypothetical protein
MGRPKGARNKKRIKRSIFLRIFGFKYFLSHEDIFIDELSKGYLKWKSKGENEYAEIYKMLLNKFTNV